MPVVECSAVRRTAAHYLGAEGALGVLHALHAGATSDGRHLPERRGSVRGRACPSRRARRACRGARAGTVGTHGVPRSSSKSTESAPGKPLGDRRATLRCSMSFPLETVRSAPGLRPARHRRADRPAGAARAAGGAASATTLVLSVAPGARAAGAVHLPAVTPESVKPRRSTPGAGRSGTSGSSPTSARRHRLRTASGRSRPRSSALHDLDLPHPAGRVRPSRRGRRLRSSGCSSTRSSAGGTPSARRDVLGPDQEHGARAAQMPDLRRLHERADLADRPSCRPRTSRRPSTSSP